MSVYQDTYTSRYGDAANTLRVHALHVTTSGSLYTLRVHALAAWVPAFVRTLRVHGLYVTAQTVRSPMFYWTGSELRKARLQMWTGTEIIQVEG